MPDTDENQLAFPQQSIQKEGLGFPICPMVAITCLETGALIDAAISPYAGKQTSETSLLRNIMNSLNKDDILIEDVVYSTYYILNKLIDRGVDFLFEQNGSRQRNFNFSWEKIGGKRSHN